MTFWFSPDSWTNPESGCNRKSEKIAVWRGPADSGPIFPGMGRRVKTRLSNVVLDVVHGKAQLGLGCNSVFFLPERVGRLGVHHKYRSHHNRCDQEGNHQLHQGEAPLLSVCRLSHQNISTGKVVLNVTIPTEGDCPLEALGTSAGVHVK